MHREGGHWHVQWKPRAQDLDVADVLLSNRWTVSTRGGNRATSQSQMFGVTGGPATHLREGEKIDWRVPQRVLAVLPKIEGTMSSEEIRSLEVQGVRLPCIKKGSGHRNRKDRD